MFWLSLLFSNTRPSKMENITIDHLTIGVYMERLNDQTDRVEIWWKMLYLISIKLPNFKQISHMLSLWNTGQRITDCNLSQGSGAAMISQQAWVWGSTSLNPSWGSIASILMPISRTNHPAFSAWWRARSTIWVSALGVRKDATKERSARGGPTASMSTTGRMAGSGVLHMTTAASRS